MADIDTVVVYQSRRLLDKEYQWRWRYRAAGNHKILANGGESFVTFVDCARSAGRVVGFDLFDNDGRDNIETRGNQRGTTQVWHVPRAGGGKLEVHVVTRR